MSIRANLSRAMVALGGLVPSASSRGAFIISISISLFTGYGGGYVAWKVQNADVQVSKDKSAFIDESRSFEIIAANYVQAIMSEQPSNGESVKLLTSNLLRQAQTLRDASRHLPLQDQSLVAAYNNLLLELNDDLPKTSSILTMREFWEDASKIIVARNELIRKLQNT